ncbi:MAG: ABC transporter permease [Nitrososphaerales archaeon]|jgi:NitT/TauT family transport system permease protein
MNRALRWAEEYAPAVLLLIAVVILWQVVVIIFKIPSYLVPLPTAVASSLVANWNLLIGNMWVTVEEILLGFAGGVAIGFALALLVVSSRVVGRMLSPLITVAQVVPKVAIAPIFLIWFGYGILSKIMITIAICFFPVILNSIKGFTTVDQDLLDLLKSLSASKTQVFLKAQLPNSIPYFMASLKISMTFAIIGAVVGEWIGASHGIGYVMLVASSDFQNPLLYAAIIVISVVGIILVGAVEVIESVLTKWKSSEVAVSV